MLDSRCVNVLTSQTCVIRRNKQMGIFIRGVKCGCVCVCKRERERESESSRELIYVFRVNLQVL